MQVYLDHGATTPARPEAIASMLEVLQSQWGNPSSNHDWGERAAMVVERSRLQVADLIGSEATEIIFTSGGTEADNLAILGIANRYPSPQHLIISQVEHSAIAQPVASLEQQGWQVTRLAVDQTGRVSPQDLLAGMRPNTVLVSIIYGQNEVGTLQPIAKLGKICRDAKVTFHVDAVQVAGKLPLNLQTLPVDLLSLSSHKLYGVQGVGALYVRSGVELVPTLTGGGQEAGLRSGTQPVAAIAAFGTAAALAGQELKTEHARLQTLRDRLFKQLADIPELLPTGDLGSDRLPHHLSFCQSLLNGREVVRSMNQAGIAISSGSACSSGKISPSPILLNMGFNQTQATGGIRLTLGLGTTELQIDYVAQKLIQILQSK